MTNAASQLDEEPTTSRRALFQIAAAAGLAQAFATAGSAWADGGDMDHMNMDHMNMDHMEMDHGSGLSPNQVLIDAALDCVKRGDVCLNHCISLLGKGDTSIKDCARTVSVMLPVCATLAKLAALEAPRLKEFAKVCSDICEDCRSECKKHADHHAVCKKCMESCDSCIQECKKYI